MALLLLAAVLAVLATTWLVGRADPNRDRQGLDNRTTQAIALAKEALIAWAVTDNDAAIRPGSLPCPDVNDDGSSDGNFGICASYLGRLPFKNLKTGDLRDGHGERLWYALSCTLRDNAKDCSGSTRPINATTAMDISLDGNTEVAAIIFSPGPPLPGQNGRPGNGAADYLDGANGDGDSSYVSGPLGDAFNDRAIPLTRAELFAAVNKRILGEIRGADDQNPAPPVNGLRAYYNAHGQFPWADADGDGRADVGYATGKLPYQDLSFDAVTGTWLSDQGWPPLVNYTRISPQSALISIGSTQLKVVPCPASPCP